MQALPHHYRLEARCGPEGNVVLQSAGLPELESAPPVEFGGPGDRWSPEALLIAAVADCIALSFRASAAASKLAWSELRLSAEGVLDREDRVMRFTGIQVAAELRVPAGERLDRAERLLARAEKSCPISNSLAVPVELEIRVREV